MTTREKNIARVKALLEKNTDNGATEAEAMAALTKANQLMKDWYILEHEINDPYLGEKCVLKEFPLIKSGYDYRLFYNDLVRLFDCEYFYNSKRISFFGFEDDVELCGYFYNLIIKSCLQEKDNYLQSPEGIVAKKHHHGRTLAASFIKGFMLRVSIKMENMYKDKVSNLPQAVGLMIIKKEEKVKEQFLEFDFDIEVRSSGEIVFEKIGFDAGMEKAENFQLTQGISDYNSDKTLKIG
ncbi:hypothetical protein CMU30_02190 [Elizabethkingia anophelis]|nr:hypothetical protein [Elizabethkingia anophelis]MDV3682186.1 hypothetical protein [Elizabethkingia anophelis]MDV3701842.1 hypothetical protein [Elizabethkingia anophelis]MDV3761148.1 hypothetical protein [Elizabethkingia anophelis]MDV3800344.1 hypothetical protein [Elizabethkingia anophelis]